MRKDTKNISVILEEYNKIINENPLSDIGASIGNKISNGITNTKASLGSRKATGEQTRNKLANTMTDSWFNWLGQTNSKGTIDDLREFLMLKVGFNNEEANQLITSEFGENNNILNRDIENNTQNNPPSDNENNNNEDSDKEEIENNDKNNDISDDSQNTPEEEKVISAADEITDSISAKARNNDMNTLNIQDVLQKCKNATDLIRKPNENISNETRLYAIDKIIDGYSAIETYNDNNQELTPEQEDNLKTVIAKIKTFGNKLKAHIEKQNNDASTSNAVSSQQTSSNDNQKNESINEDEILDNDTIVPKKTILKFFKDAAAFAYKYNLVGKKRNKTPYGVPVSYGNSQSSTTQQNYSNIDRGSGRNYVPQDENEKDEKRFNRRMDKTWDRAETLGLSSDDIQDTKALALDNKFQNIHNKADIDKLAAIGWSFLRSIR